MHPCTHPSIFINFVYTTRVGIPVRGGIGCGNERFEIKDSGRWVICIREEMTI